MISIFDLDSYLCSPGMPIRDVMGRIDRLPVRDKFQVVVDDNRRVLGTVTDGDIRRGLLRGNDLLDQVSTVMHVTMKLGSNGMTENNAMLFSNLEINIPFLPVVDELGRVCEIIVPSRRAANRPKVHALVQAGGFGKRLGAKTRDVPKPLLHIGGRSILDYTLERLENSDVSTVWLSIHYLPEKIEEFIAKRTNKIEIKLLREVEPLGTAGSIGLISDRSFTDLLVVNGDILTQLDFDAIINYHHEQGNEVTIAAAIHEVQIPFGVIRYSENGRFNHIDEKPILRHFVSAGINLVTRELCDLVSGKEMIDMPCLIHRGKGKGMSVGVFPIHEYWTDVGTPQDFADADKVHQVD